MSGASATISPTPSTRKENALDATQIALLAGAGLVAGVINTLAGGGSLLTVPLLVVMGLPGTLANGTNRVGILAQSVAAAWRFRADGVSGLRDSAPILVPVLLGSLVGALAVSRFSDQVFERAFGLVMLAVLLPTLRPPRSKRDAPATQRPWPRWLALGVFFAIGVYGGSFQAGVGIILILALSRAGFDLVRANSIKMVVVAAFTAVAVPVFAMAGQIHWPSAIALTLGYIAGGIGGARLAISGGERLIRPVLALAVVALAGRMLELY